MRLPASRATTGAGLGGLVSVRRIVGRTRQAGEVLSDRWESRERDGSSSFKRYSRTARIMALRIVRLGDARLRGEGLRVGTVRRPPRGVRKEDFAKLDYFDAWLPELAPSAEIVSWAMAEPLTDKRWATFSRRYRSEMATPAARHLLTLLASLSKQTNLSVGCYCEDESRCHRSLLRELLVEAGAVIV